MNREGFKRKPKNVKFKFIFFGFISQIKGSNKLEEKGLKKGDDTMLKIVLIICWVIMFLL